MNQIYLLDVILLFFLLQYFIYMNNSMIKGLHNVFFSSLEDVFSYNIVKPLSSIISVFLFIILLFLCFFGYFCYSSSFCMMIEFTFIFSLIAWLSTLINYFNMEKFSIYLSKSGDNFLKTMSMLMVELVSEFSRPLALTVRLTVNIMVGHLISMSLYMLFELVLSDSYIYLTLLAILMECFVFFIQSYIFSRLIFLYLNE